MQTLRLQPRPTESTQTPVGPKNLTSQFGAHDIKEPVLTGRERQGAHYSLGVSAEVAEGM